MRRWLLGVALLCFAGTTPIEAANRWWFGGGIGAAFGGNVDWLSVEPAVGYWFTPKFTAGGRVILRYRKDKRYDEDISTTDYGAAAFARYFIIKHVFLQGEYDYLNYEYLRFDGTTDRDTSGALFGGAGFAQPIGRHSSFFMVGLYNFTYEEKNRSPYSGPWLFRVGFGFGF